MTWSIRDRATFGELKTKGRRSRRGALSVRCVPAPAPGVGVARVAFAVPRSVGPAVVRNKVRRRLRAAVRELASEAPELLPDGAYLLGASPQAAKRSYAELRSDLRAALAALRSPRPGA